MTNYAFKIGMLMYKIAMSLPEATLQENKENIKELELAVCELIDENKWLEERVHELEHYPSADYETFEEYL